MQALKVVGLGLLFSFVGTIGYILLSIFIGILRGPVTIEESHATGLSAVIGGLIEAIVSTVFNPICWLLVALSFGLAFWLVRSRQKPKSA